MNFQVIPFCKFQFKIIFLYYFLAFVISGCNNDEQSIHIDVGYDYFPCSVGTWFHYDVDSTIWDDFTSQTYEYHSQILEVIESQFIDNEGNPAFRIERYYRASDSADWVIKDIWFANLKPASAEKVEENVRFVKLTFPVHENFKWDGNAFNYLNEENYAYKGLHESITAGSNHYDSTITVEHKNSYNLIEEDNRYEVYAKHIGLVKKYSKTVKKNIAQPDVIVSGNLVEYNLRHYGKNN